MQRTGRREKLLIREECGYYKIRWMEEKNRGRERQGIKNIRQISQGSEKKETTLDFFFGFFFPPFCNFYHFLGGELGERL